jgi:hypothetical protein
MRVALFFVCLCYLLLGGYNYIYTGARCDAFSYAQELHFEKNNQKFTDKTQGHPANYTANSNQDATPLISEDLEDEDSNDILARKFKLQGKCYLTLSGLFLLTYLFSRFKGPRPYYWLLSYKYIHQRVLRI